MNHPEPLQNSFRNLGLFNRLCRPSGFLIAAVSATTIFSGAASAADIQPPPSAESGIVEPSVSPFDEFTPQQQEAVTKGLHWLARQQNPDGHFGKVDSAYGATSGITALAALAFMSAGNLPGRGLYGQNVQRALDYILSTAQTSGFLSTSTGQGSMYSHGFATLFLAEVYGMTADETVSQKLHQAVRLIEQAQNKEGGWRYTPIPTDADISVTICQVMALRAAREAGIVVGRDTIDRAIAYVQRCQNDDGGFRYMAHNGTSAFARSAAGVAALYYAGASQGDAVQRGLKYLANVGPVTPQGTARQSNYFYGQYYAVQAMFLAGGQRWESWYPAIRDELVRNQVSDGRWNGEVSQDYCTALALIVLQMPNRYLPVFSGKGSGS